MQQQVIQVHKEMEVSAQKKDFKLALQQCNDLGTKVDAFNTALKELENKRRLTMMRWRCCCPSLAR